MITRISNWLDRRSGGQLALLLFAVGGAVVFGVGYGAGSITLAAQSDDWSTEEAVIVEQPRFFDDNSRVQALVEVGGEGGEQIVTAVEDQARPGDRVTVWRNTDTGELWRARSATATPVTNPVAWGVGAVTLACFVGLIALFADAMRERSNRTREYVECA